MATCRNGLDSWPQFLPLALFLAACGVLVLDLSVSGLSYELFPLALPALPTPSLQVPLAKVGLFGWETPFAQGPKEEVAAGMSQIGTFSCENPRTGPCTNPQTLCCLKLMAQKCLPHVCFFMMSRRHLDLCVGLRTGPSPGRLQRRPNQFLSLSQAYTSLLLLLRALVTACGCDGHRVQVLFLLFQGLRCLFPSVVCEWRCPPAYL